MIIMLEKKAQEIFTQYMQAEIQGRNEEAAQLERMLNEGGWYVVTGPEGPTIRKQENTIPVVEEYLTPKERSYQPYTESDRKGYKTVWIVLGVIAAISVIAGAIYLYRKHKANAAARV